MAAKPIERYRGFTPVDGYEPCGDSILLHAPSPEELTGDWEDGDLYVYAPCPFRATVQYYGLNRYCPEHDPRGRWLRNR